MRGPRRTAHEQSRHALGERGIARERHQMVLPQVDIPLRKLGNIRRIRHEVIISARVSDGQKGSRGSGTAMLCCALWRRLFEGVGRTMADKSGADAQPVVIKKYANRRLYNTATSSYVTLDDLSRMVKQGNEFVVYDAKSGEEITRAVLTQIIVEEEQKGQNLLPISFLRQLISLYGDSMQWLVPRYLEHAMTTFARNQEQMRKSLQDAFGGLFPFGPLEEMGKQNLALFEKTMKMFSPFPANSGEKPRSDNAEEAGGEATLDELRQRINNLQQQVNDLSHKKE
jgi:polyhydroxyalkanoate synthesis repressor PhaR